jgi:hypothetical protein
MQFSAWSEAESGVTMEVGVGEGATCDSRHADTFASPQRCVLPKVQPAFNRSDQQVPVYRDQTVPVWLSCNQPEAASSKLKLTHKSSGIGHGEFSPSTYLRSSPGDDASSEGTETDYNDGYGRRRNFAAASQVSNSEVSFDDIMSMYQSSVMEKTSHKWSRALRAILKHRSRKRHVYRQRLWRRLARNLDSSATLGLSVKLKCSRFGQRHAPGDVEESLLWSLQEAIERTSICDSSSSNPHTSDMSLLPADHAVFQVRRYDLPDHFQRRCDPLMFTSPMLTTSSS